MEFYRDYNLGGATLRISLPRFFFYVNCAVVRVETDRSVRGFYLPVGVSFLRKSVVGL